MARRRAFRDQAAFRKAYPTLESPARIYASAEARAAVAAHAALGDRMGNWFEDRRSRQEVDSVHAMMLPANAAG